MVRASEQHVDLLVLQEVTPAVLADMDRAGLPDLLPYRIGLAGSMATGTMAFAQTPRRPTPHGCRPRSGAGASTWGTFACRPCTRSTPSTRAAGCVTRPSSSGP